MDLAEKARTPARKLSRGMQQKLALAVALVSGAPVLLLDEPTLGLDVHTSLEIRNHLRRIAREEGRTVLVTTHDMHVVEDICATWSSSTKDGWWPMTARKTCSGFSASAPTI